MATPHALQEAERLLHALKDPEFVHLFNEYAQHISSPAVCVRVCVRTSSRGCIQSSTLMSAF